MRYEKSLLSGSRGALGAVVALTLGLQGCATPTSPPAETAAAPVAEAAAAPGQQASDTAVPELKLNLPQNQTCECPPAPAADYTFYEKGYQALLDGEYEEAMDYFQRFQRLESSPRADFEAEIAIAYVRMLPRTSLYNPVLARASFKVLREKNAKDLGVHDYTRLMRQALLNMLKLEQQIDELNARNATLAEDLKKREDALKRLRDLTLKATGQ